MKAFLIRCPSPVTAVLFALMTAKRLQSEAFAPSGSLNLSKGRENSFLLSTAAESNTPKKQRKSFKGGDDMVMRPKESANKKKKKSTKKSSKKKLANKSGSLDLPKGKENNSPLSTAAASNTPKKQRKSFKGGDSPRKKKSTSKSAKKKLADKSFKPIKDLKLGSTVSGTVVDVCDFGAFVSIGYATRGSRIGTALLHISHIRDKKISDIHSLYKAGDEIEGARVISVDMKKGEVGLSLRPRRNERTDFSTYNVGDVLKGKVKSVVSYGAFIDVGANVNPLLHLSRITGGAIENVRHHINEGDAVSVHVIDIDLKTNRVAVSLLNEKADLYLDRRMSQRLKRNYGTVSVNKGKEDAVKDTTDDHFDLAIQELEEALMESRTPELI